MRSFIIFFLVLSPVFVAQAQFAKEFQKLKEKSKIADSDFGALILAHDKQEILSLNPSKKLIAASISKIATSVAVLENFPIGHKFKTQILIQSDVQDQVLKGDLYLKGGGDPSFVSENMWYLVNVFSRRNIKKIQGDIIVDDQLFDNIRFDQSRQAERVDRAYDAPVGALSFNWNSVNIFVQPTKPGQPAQVVLDPESDYLILKNKTSTVKGSKNSLTASRVSSTDGKDVIQVSGDIGDEKSEQVIYKSITQPEIWTGYQLKSFLAQRGIQVLGTIKKGKTPETAKVVAENESKPIESIVADMNKFSNNYVAEMLAKNLGALSKQPAKLEDGTQKIKEHLLSLGITDDLFHFENPSGLTRHNQVTALGMMKLLIHLKENFRVFPEFMSSLPISGIDGTLKRRMKDQTFEGRVRAKTGLLTGVVSLAGYTADNDGNTFTFVFIYNGPRNEADVRSFFDQSLRLLLK